MFQVKREKTDARGYLCEPDFSEEELKRIKKEKEATAEAERQAQPPGKEEKSEPAGAGPRVPAV